MNHQVVDEHFLQGNDQNGRPVWVEAGWVVGIGRISTRDMMAYVQLIDGRCVTISKAFEDVLEFLNSAQVTPH